MSELLLEILSFSLPMTALILLLCPLSRLLGKRFTAKCRYIVWTLVLLRLCLPVGMVNLPSLIQVNLTAEPVETVLPLPERLPKPEEEKLSVSESILPAETFSEPEYFSAPTAEDSSVPPVYEMEILEKPSDYAPVEIPVSQTEIDIPDETAPVETDVYRMETEVPEIVETPPLPTVDEEKDEPSFSPLTFLGRIWLLGVTLYLGVHLVSYHHYVRRLRRTCTDAPANVRCLHRKLCKTYAIRRPPQLKISRDVRSPLLCGYLHPCVILPDVRLTKGQTVSILAHELTHYRRHDLWVKFACVFGCALHWFNPVVHLAAGRCHAEMELSCDEAVLAGMDEDTRRRYGKVMLDIVRRCGRTNTVLTTQFNPKKQAVRERFLNIMDMSKKKRGIAVILVAAALCSLAGMVFAYDVEAPADNKNFIKINDNVSIRIGLGTLPGVPMQAEDDLAETEKEPAKTEEKIDEPEEALPVTYTFGGITFSLPAEIASLVTITDSQWPNGLFDVYHNASVENGAPGWIYSIGCHTYEELVRDDVNHGGIRYFAATPDNTAFYYLLSPTDVQYDPSDKTTSEEYQYLSNKEEVLMRSLEETYGLVIFKNSDIPDIVHLTADTVFMSYAPSTYPIRLEFDETYGWLLRGDGAGPYGMALGDSLTDADIYAEWVTETCCRLSVDGVVYDLYRKDAAWTFEESEFTFGWENNLPVWTPTDALTAATESDLLHRAAYEKMDTEEFLALTTIQDAFVREMTALVEPYRPESPDTATVHGDPYYVPDGVVFPETVAWEDLNIKRNPAKRQEWTITWYVGEMLLRTYATIERRGTDVETYHLVLTDPEFELIQPIFAEEGDLRPVLEALATDSRTDYIAQIIVSNANRAQLTVEISGEGRDLHQTKKIGLRSIKALEQTLTFDTPFDLWTVASVSVFGVDNAVVLNRLSTAYQGISYLLTSRGVYEYSTSNTKNFSVVLYEENGELRYRHSSNLLNPVADNVLGNATARDNFSYECGYVEISGGRPQFYTADQYYTVDDVFDLDADFERYWKSDAYPTLDALLSYNAERYRDMHDYPTTDETPLPAVYSDEHTVPRLPLVEHEIPTYFNKDKAYTKTETAYKLDLTTVNAGGKELTTSIRIPQLSGTSAVIEEWNRELYERIRDHYAFLVYDYEKNDKNNYYVEISYQNRETNGVASVTVVYQESTCMSQTVTTVRRAEVYHYDTVADKFLTNEEYLARLTNGTMTMQSLLDGLNEQNTRYVLNGSEELYTISELYGILPSAWNDGGIDVILPIADRSAGLGRVTEDGVTTILHYVPAKTYPTYTVEEGFTATYRVVRQYDDYRIFCNIVDKRDLPVAEENQSKRRIISACITEDYAVDFYKDEYFGAADTFVVYLTYTGEHGLPAERKVSFAESPSAESYFRWYLEGTYDMDTLMNHTVAVPASVYNEVSETLRAYKRGERPFETAPLFPENCAVPEIPNTEDIVKYYQTTGESEYPFKISLPLENGQTMDIYWKIDEELEVVQRIKIRALPNVLLAEDADWNWWITDPTEGNQRLMAGDLEYTISEYTPEPLPSTKDEWSGFLLARTIFTVPDPTAELTFTCTVNGYAQIWLYQAADLSVPNRLSVGLSSPGIKIAEFENADGTYTIPVTEEIRQVLLDGQAELLVHAEGTYFSLTLSENE